MKNEATCTTDEQISGYDSKNTVCASYAHPAGGCSNDASMQDDCWKLNSSKVEPMVISIFQWLAGWLAVHLWLILFAIFLRTIEILHGEKFIIKNQLLLPVERA
jgi:hypothetical protein